LTHWENKQDSERLTDELGGSRRLLRDSNAFQVCVLKTNDFSLVQLSRGGNSRSSGGVEGGGIATGPTGKVVAARGVFGLTRRGKKDTLEGRGPPKLQKNDKAPQTVLVLQGVPNSTT